LRRGLAGARRALAGFRRELYRCLTARGDELFELCDAVLCADGPVRDLAGLSLVPGHRRGRGAVYDAVNAGAVDIGRLRWAVGCVPLLAWPDGRIRLASMSAAGCGRTRGPRSGGISAGHRAGEGLPSSRRHPRYVPRPIRRGVPHGRASRLHTASMAFTLISGARHSLHPPSRAGPLTTPQASRHATDRIVAPPYRASDAGLRPGPFPGQAASLLPGLLTATRTGLPPAGDDELTNTKIHHGITSRCHLLLYWAHE
jgi:hypothetical protein